MRNELQVKRKYDKTGKYRGRSKIFNKYGYKKCNNSLCENLIFRYQHNVANFAFCDSQCQSDYVSESQIKNGKRLSEGQKLSRKANCRLTDYD